jgi:hypothetical protein
MSSEMNVDVVHLIQQYMQPNDIIKQRLVHSSFNHASKFHHKIWKKKLEHLQINTLPMSYLFQGYEFRSEKFDHHPMAKTERRRNIKNGGDDNVYLEHCRTCVNDKMSEWLRQSDDSLSEYEKYELVIRNVTKMSNSMPTPEIAEYYLNKILEFGNIAMYSHILALCIHVLAHPLLLLLLLCISNYLLQLYMSYYLYTISIEYLIIFIPNIYRVYLMHCSRTLSQLQLVLIYTHLIVYVLHIYELVKITLVFSPSAHVWYICHSFYLLVLSISSLKDKLIQTLFQFANTRHNNEVIINRMFAFIVLFECGVTIGLFMLMKIIHVAQL